MLKDKKKDEERARNSSFADKSSEADEPEQEGPNISLNIHKHRTAEEMRFFATLAVLIQAGVLCWAGIITYYPPMIRLKSGFPMEFYAYPLTSIGILMVNLGMLICASVIERKTKEEYWSAKPKLNSETKPKLHALWIQRRAFVNDQLFDAYAIIADLEHDSILRSRPAGRGYADSGPRPNATRMSGINVVCGSNTSLRRRPTLQQSKTDMSGASNRPLLRRATAGLSTRHTPAPTLIMGRYSQNAWVLAGVILGVAGFVVQFVGLRAMEWTVSIAQLVATAIMIVVRAWVRRGVTKEPRTEQLSTGFELEWLAMQVYDGASRL